MFESTKLHVYESYTISFHSTDLQLSAGALGRVAPTCADTVTCMLEFPSFWKMILDMIKRGSGYVCFVCVLFFGLCVIFLSLISHLSSISFPLFFLLPLSASFSGVRGDHSAPREQAARAGVGDQVARHLSPSQVHWRGRSFRRRRDGREGRAMRAWMEAPHGLGVCKGFERVRVA